MINLIGMSIRIFLETNKILCVYMQYVFPLKTYKNMLSFTNIFTTRKLNLKLLFPMITKASTRVKNELPLLHKEQIKGKI